MMMDLYLTSRLHTSERQRTGDEISAFASIVFKDTKFEYVHEIESENRMILEFEAEMDGKYVNGVDIVDFDDDGLITQFKVMVRPLQAVNMLWQQMGAQLEQASA